MRGFIISTHQLYAAAIGLMWSPVEGFKRGRPALTPRSSSAGHLSYRAKTVSVIVVARSGRILACKWLIHTGSVYERVKRHGGPVVDRLSQTSVPSYP
jgi:hypothetical protein